MAPCPRQVGLTPGRAVAPSRVYRLRKWSPCSWEEADTPLSEHRAPSLPCGTCTALPAVTLTVNGQGHLLAWNSLP